MSKLLTNSNLSNRGKGKRPYTFGYTGELPLPLPLGEVSEHSEDGEGGHTQND